jgi:Zn-dependent protease
MYRTIRLGFLKTSQRELIDIGKAWLVISLAFAIVMSGGLLNVRSIGTHFIIAAIAVGIGFLLHELAHKLVAQHYGCAAEFRSFDQMLLVAVILSLLGFVFAAPGAVIIAGHVTRRENGKISAAGPLTNFTLALIFLLLSYVNSTSLFIRMITVYGFQINIWLGLFNLIPFWNFDGKKIMYWNRYVWGAMLLFGIFFMYLF